MPRGRPAVPITLGEAEKTQLLSLANSRALPHGLVQRAQIVLACAEGETSSAIAKRMHLTNATVGPYGILALLDHLCRHFGRTCII